MLSRVAVFALVAAALAVAAGGDAAAPTGPVAVTVTEGAATPGWATFVTLELAEDDLAERLHEQR